jgi:RsmE family RNA methyltransferase
MNLCMLDSSDVLQTLPVEDRRAQHILRVLKKREGDRLRAGSPDGLVGWACLESISAAQLVLRFSAEDIAPPLRPVRVMLGTVRPIQAARIVKELTILGVSEIAFFPTELGEKSYTQSNFYTQKEYYIHAREGAEQAGNPRIPHISLAWSLKRALDQVSIAEISKDSQAQPPRKSVGGPVSEDGHVSIDGPPLGALPHVSSLPQGTATNIVCHPDDSAIPLSRIPLSATPVVLAIGTERGWTASELRQFQECGFVRCSLGDRILKTETAAVVAVSMVLAGLGYF